MYPKYYDEIFQKYNVDLVVCTSLGTFANDEYLLRAAKKNRIKTTSLMLSWDNSTTRGYPGCKSGKVIAWTENMMKELIALSDIKKNTIYIGGSAQFDHYFKDLKITKNDFLRKFNLDEDKKILFFATRGPNTYASNVDIIRVLCESIDKNEIPNSQLDSENTPIAL